MMSSTDAELVADVDRGAVAAFGALVERHRGGMVAAATRVLGPSADVEDVVHESLLTAWDRIGRLRDPSTAGAWLRGIARNVALQRIRATRELPAERIGPGGAPTGRDWPDRVVEDAVMRDELWAAISELSEPLRLAVVLRHFCRASTYMEIAAVSGVPVGTVRSRLSEGRRQLAEVLRREAVVAYGTHDKMAANRRSHFIEAFDGYNRGNGSLFVAALTDDVEIHAGGGIERGKASAEAGMCDDMAAGVKLRILDVIAGPGITVIEGRFENPPENPTHCPVVTTQVYLHTSDAVRSIRLHFGADAKDRDPSAEPADA